MESLKNLNKNPDMMIQKSDKGNSAAAVTLEERLILRRWTKC